MKKQKGFVLPIILVIAAVAVIGAAGYFVYQKEAKKETNVSPDTTIGTNSTSTGKTETQLITPNTKKEQVVCTQDAKQCPDGSYVSRTGPNCEFAPCQGIANETADWKTYRNNEYGFEFKYPKNWFIMNKSTPSSIRFSTGVGDENCETYIEISNTSFDKEVQEVETAINIVGKMLSKKDIYVSNHKGIEYVVHDTEENLSAKVIVFSANSKTYLFMHCTKGEKNNPLLSPSKLISTFKFTK